MSDTEFCGVGGYSAKALGEFQTNIIINEHSYPIFIRVVPDTVLQYGLLIGADFIDTIEINFKKGVISISPACELTVGNESRPEIFTIDAIRDSNTIDIDT